MFDISSEIKVKSIYVECKPIFEIQNFYKNPNLVREYAIESKKYSRKDNPDLLAYVLGRRVCEDDLRICKNSGVFKELCNNPNWHIEFDLKQHEYYWSGMRFIVNVCNNAEILESSKKHFFHVDGPRHKWASVVYLNVNEECEGGTGFCSYDSKKDSINLEYTSKMEYNKAVLYDANMIHGPILEKTMFKNCDRLVQVMFM